MEHCHVSTSILRFWFLIFFILTVKVNIIIIRIVGGLDNLVLCIHVPFHRIYKHLLVCGFGTNIHQTMCIEFTLVHAFVVIFKFKPWRINICVKHIAIKYHIITRFLKLYKSYFGVVIELFQ
jgi:hypothetical protein